MWEPSCLRGLTGALRDPRKLTSTIRDALFVAVGTDPTDRRYGLWCIAPAGTVDDGPVIEMQRRRLAALRANHILLGSRHGPFYAVTDPHCARSALLFDVPKRARQRRDGA